MLPDDLQNLGNVDVYALAVPPLLFAIVACEEPHLGSVGQYVLNLEHVRL
ncbi:MAG: hypothetical protein IH943_08360 [Acidobacteria bacterium]|nr:hypothetical protein [Acidobacteriota bacterium]